MPARYSHGANAEMLLLLAWLSTLKVQEQARQDREACPWKYPYQPPWSQDRLPVFPEHLVHGQVALARENLKRDPIYGPLFEALVRYRLTSIDFSLVAGALELEGLTDPTWALFFSDSSSPSKRRQDTTFVDEADAFWQVASSHMPLADRLTRLSQTWHGDICRGAGELSIFFSWYLDLAARFLPLPFFLVELVRISLHRMDWHVIAAHVLEIPLPVGCQCANRTQEVPVGARAEYLGELFKATGDETLSLGQQLPEPERTQALFLADLCRETTKAMRLVLLDGEG
ncbi:hypothetical protein KSF_106690 [Reticulibacter mediterranei]|uniref:Uncharacterized protein n=1 Tax=Reticulibacter mediterranei TaxID=2778369 RepID=A0A8J3J310_9CHLR|nr:hypothetical protein [Reticulibacter mediterranei]GHP00622.1 hypothetical protein KSF_106690 [Reticulibacter mediterranei]